MSKTNTPAVKLAPVVAKTAKAAATLAQQDGRKRPIVAINEDGHLVVCCRRTAKKNGWQVQDVLYERTKPAAKVEESAPVKAATKKTPQRHKSGSNDAVAASKEKVKAAKEAVDSALDEILGK